MFLLNFCGLALFFNKHRKMFYNEENKNFRNKYNLSRRVLRSAPFIHNILKIN